MSETPRLSPGDTAPDFTLTDDTGDRGLARRPARPQGDRLLLPGRDDPGLHQAGLRLHRLARLAAGAGLRGARHLPRQAGEAGEVPRARRPRPSRLLSDPDRSVHDGVRRVRREEALRQGRPGRHPLDVRRRRGRQVVELAQYNVKATGHVAKLPQGPRASTVVRRMRPSRARSPTGRGTRFRSWPVRVRVSPGAPVRRPSSRPCELDSPRIAAGLPRWSARA